MSNATTEEIGVSNLKIAISKTHLAQTNFTTNDKGLSWDGYIAVYKRETFTKKDFYGNIPVQIKTSHEDDVNKNRFQISRDDLLNYKTENRVMYFHISLSKRDKATIFYLPMHLLDLERNVKSIDANNESKVFTFKRFPKSIKAIIDVLFEFVTEANKQKELMPGILSVQDLIREKGNVPLSFEIPVSKKNTLFDIPRIIEEKEPYIRYRSEDTKLEHVVDRLSGAKVYLEIEKFMNVGFEDGVVYENKTVQGDSEAFIIKCSPTFKITITPEQVSFQYNFSAGNFEDKCLVASFLNRLIKEGSFVINKQKIQMSTEEQKRLESKAAQDVFFFTRFDSFMKALHLKKEPILNASENDFLVFHILSTCVLDEKPVKNLGIEDGLVFFDLFGLHLLFCVISNGDYSFAINWCHDKYITLAAPDKPNEAFSPYYYLSSLNENYFLAADNIDIDLIEENIFKGNIDERKAALINNIVMNLISYYDAKPDCHTLDVASSIIKRLLNAHSENVSAFVNSAQIEYRRNQLTPDIKAKLNSIIRSGEKDSVVIFACLTLLADEKSIDSYNNLDSATQKAIDKWPILKIYRELFDKQE